MIEVWEVLKWTAIVVGWTVTPIILLTLSVLDFRRAFKFKNYEFMWTSNMWSGTLFGIAGISFPIAAIIATIRYCAS